MLTPIAVAEVLVDKEKMENELSALDLDEDLGYGVTDCLRRKNYCTQGLYLLVKDERGKIEYAPLDAHEIGKYASLPRRLYEPVYYENLPEIMIKNKVTQNELDLVFIYPNKAAQNCFLIKINVQEVRESKNGPIYSFRDLVENKAW